LVVLAAPVPLMADRVAARFGELIEAPVVITEGLQLPMAGLLLALPALEMTGLLEVATETFPPMSKGFYGLHATLLMGVFLALPREPRAEAATRIRPTDLGRLLGLDWAPEVRTLRRRLAELAGHAKGAALQALGRHHATTPPSAPTRSGSATWTGTSGSIPGPGSCPRPTSPGCGSPARPPERPGSPAPTATQ
jgi:hypothetical protein